MLKVAHPGSVIDGIIRGVLRDPADSPATQTPAEAAGVQTHPDPKARQEYLDLKRLEEAVKAYRTSWIEAGRSLAEISRRGLYAACGRRSFDEYVSDCLRLSRRHAYDLIAGSAVARNVEPVKHALSLRAALALGKLPPEKQPLLLRELVAEHGLSPSEKQVAEAVAGELGAPAKRKRAKKPKAWRKKLADGNVVTITTKRAVADIAALLRELLALA